jgi:hypothetical protein
MRAIKKGVLLLPTTSQVFPHVFANVVREDRD